MNTTKLNQPHLCYSLPIVCSVFPLCFQASTHFHIEIPSKRNLSEGEKDIGESAQNRYSVMQIMTAKTTTLQTLYIHIVLNSAIFPQILYGIVLYA